MKTSLLLSGIVLLVFIANTTTAGTIIASSSGKWDDKTSWAGGKIPQCGDSVIIGAGKIIEATSIIDFNSCGNPMHLTIIGTLNFQSGNKMLLPCGSKIALKEGGLISVPRSGGFSNSIDICSSTAWKSTKGNVPGPATLEVAPKPVDLVHFSAKPGTEGIILSWMTASEKSNGGFVVEKSTDGQTFSELATVNSTGNGTSMSNYKFIDKNPAAGLQYYRLSQKNSSGEIKSMTPITIRWNHNPDFSIYPNPSKGALFANVANNLKKKIGLLMITNKNGNVVISKDISFVEKTKALSLLKQSEYLKPGEYEVNVICQGYLYTQEVIVE